MKTMPNTSEVTAETAANSNSNFHHKWLQILEQAEQVILGKRKQVQLALCAFLADGHILVEDVPGVGKTTLVKFLVKITGLQSHRIQFTNDMLPADIIGTSIFDASQGEFRFHKGPLFSQIVVADELNRATPKTQSACLQAMEEGSVSIDGKTYDLGRPFFLIATQNPREQAGTYDLPESQLDRFLMRLEMGYPDRQSERVLLQGQSRSLMLDQITPLINMHEILESQKRVQAVFVSEAVLDYVQDILDKSRSQSVDQWGLSPRAGLALLRAAKAWAFLEGRDMVLPDDVQAVGIAVMGHRLNRSDERDSKQGLRMAEEILSTLAVD